LDKEWMTPREVAEYLKISLPTVYRWTREGIFKKYKAGRTSRFLKSEVDAAMKADLEGQQ
jgi:excisionase family DNA binding protein